jgi:predicted dehydrogenase
MALDVAECDAILAACAAAGVKLTVNFVTRFRDAPLAMKRVIDDGTIGDIRMIEMRGTWTSFILEDVIDQETGRVIVPRKDWAFDPAEGSQFLDWGVHETDALRWLTGSEAERAFATYRTYGTPPPVDLSAMVRYDMANGVMASLLMTYETPEPGIEPNDSTRIIGSKGIIEADHYGAVRLGTGSGWSTVAEQVPFDFLRDYLDPNRLKGFAAQVEDFAAAIEEDRDPAVTGEDGRKAVEMVEAADRSAATGEVVSLPLTSAARP